MKDKFSYTFPDFEHVFVLHAACTYAREMHDTPNIKYRFFGHRASQPHYSSIINACMDVYIQCEVHPWKEK